MRSRLPSQALRWAQTQAGSEVVDAFAVGGGMTATKWVLRLAEGEPLVIRWSDPAVWDVTGREHVRREATALRLLAGSPVPVAALVASDPDGESAGGPANLMSWRPGRVRLDQLGPAAVTALADLAVAVHRRPVPAAQRPPVFTFRGPAVPVVPDWTPRPRLWRQAIDLRLAGPPPTPYGLLHRDFHFGNTVWQGDAITGLVDWAETSWGPPDLDVAHLCADFAMLHGVADAELFRTAYLERGGRLDPDPDAASFWVISDIIGFLPDPAHILVAVGPSRPDLSAEAVRRGLEDLLEHTLR